MRPLVSPKDMTEDERGQIVTAAFVAYIMQREMLPQEAALQRMATLVTLMQVALFGTAEDVEAQMRGGA